MPIKHPADMIEYLRTMPPEEIAERQAALRVARSKFFYMQLPHSRGTTSSQVSSPAARSIAHALPGAHKQCSSCERQCGRSVLLSCVHAAATHQQHHPHYSVQPATSTCTACCSWGTACAVSGRAWQLMALPTFMQLSHSHATAACSLAAALP